MMMMMISIEYLVTITLAYNRSAGGTSGRATAFFQSRPESNDLETEILSLLF